ncbi:hypothetical protein COU62_01935 [Candidatus Pacearchaeota archaeon CG10_big_fil_rev_8_21_14_0_10_35_219]|nr:hypothetical protein [Candidatus Pacearchaeota archaeon]OIO42535.1 MAG: hypothetical protein AUJ63_02525 [Candidatus Pacearchaeota archaeon CG1_02_35_32]PIO07952.1 MAG: hypothetical protein COU62_01935 [Candidatus Pacearchaeota archaeon CG10_big_fil_rev_8_21_14_0_10_35_219]PIY81407.1 MAG: hypothetical protein COY79_02745 [Candidatus Pacearchaeota archaeon CG_4_10_14_0_8_um_filter_35_169]PIZ80629.1 MAG: hypothetical protein COY00_00700 [Candidatus Pacearchaeota archaeon CG_4_10_14_0_2_um_filt
MKQSKEDKLDEITECINQKDSLYHIHKKDAARFEDESKKEGKGTIPIMTYGEYVIYLKADSSIPNIPLSKFNYTSGTFEKKWGPEHKTIVLTPNHSSIRKVEIEIQGIDIHKMELLPDKTGDVIEDTAKIKITRHYRFAKGDSENKGDSISASPGKTNAR